MIRSEYKMLFLLCAVSIACSACANTSTATDMTVPSVMEANTEDALSASSHASDSDISLNLSQDAFPIDSASSAVAEENTLSAMPEENETEETAAEAPAEESSAEETAYVSEATEPVPTASVSEAMTTVSSSIPETAAQPPADIPTDITQYSSFVVAGNAAYEQYGYDDKLADSYASAINAAGDALKGTAAVYNIVVPISIGIALPDEYRAQLNPADQRDAINKLYSKMNANVKAVSIFDSLYEHREEYLYFRTDHHWTALAAYYAYEDFCEVKGIKANPLLGYKTITFDGFLGSFYTWSDNSPALGNTPDYVTAYYPLASSTTMVCENADGSFKWPVINDVSSYQSYNKYGAFIGGDNAFTTITNADLHDGSSCVVIKESFGNAFVPFLVDHYQTVYVIDFRQYQGKLADFVEENGVQDVIYINSISMTRGSETIGLLAGIL